MYALYQQHIKTILAGHDGYAGTLHITKFPSPPPLFGGGGGGGAATFLCVITLVFATVARCEDARTKFAESKGVALYISKDLRC